MASSDPRSLPRLLTGTSSRTVTYYADGSFHTTEPPPLCDDCKEPMHPLAWLCGGCGGVQ